MTICPQCGSSFLQPLRCEAKGSDVLLVELRCSSARPGRRRRTPAPTCGSWIRKQAEFRATIVDGYERSVAESMEALATCFGHALALDLVTADDFRPAAPRA